MLSKRTHELRPHPLNHRIYGDAADDELLESIRVHGVLAPLLITSDNVVISGHRRLDAAKKLGLEKVPVVVSAITDKREVERALIHANEQRQRTVEQKIREYKHLKAIEEKLARERQVEAGAHGAKGGRGKNKDKETLRDKVPQGFAGRSGVIAAKPFELSYKTLDRGVQVVEHIDALVKEGKAEEVEALRAALNKSVGTAFRISVRPEAKRTQGRRTDAEDEASVGGAQPLAEPPAVGGLPTTISGWENHDPLAALGLLLRSLLSAGVAFKKGERAAENQRVVDALERAAEPLEQLLRELTPAKGQGRRRPSAKALHTPRRSRTVKRKARAV